MYTNSLGVEMDDLKFSEALEIVLSLAENNQISENDVAHGDKSLAAQREWQQLALETLDELLMNRVKIIDSLPSPDSASEWPEPIITADRNLDPENPLNAIRICLEMSDAAAIDPKEAQRDMSLAERDMSLAEECDRQQEAFDIVRDLIGLHGKTLEKMDVSAPIKK